MRINDATIESVITVTFSVQWREPSDRNGSFHYEIQYEATQNEPYPQSRQISINPTTMEVFDENLLPGQDDIVEYVFNGALPYADYNITVTPVNTKLNRPALSVSMSGRTIAIGTYWFTHSCCYCILLVFSSNICD